MKLMLRSFVASGIIQTNHTFIHYFSIMSQTLRSLTITEQEETVLVEMIKFFNDMGLPDDINSTDYDTLCDKICEPAFWEYN